MSYLFVRTQYFNIYSALKTNLRWAWHVYVRLLPYVQMKDVPQYITSDKSDSEYCFYSESLLAFYSHTLYYRITDLFATYERQDFIAFLFHQSRRFGLQIETQ
jgi:hypothetical protein